MRSRTINICADAFDYSRYLQALDGYVDMFVSFGFAPDTAAVIAVKQVIEVGAQTYLTAVVVQILTSIDDKVEKRKQMLHELKLIENLAMDTTEDVLFMKPLLDQKRKIRKLG